jgi:hypothetical protein
MPFAGSVPHICLHLADVGLAERPSGGVTASTEVIAARRHTGVHASVIVCKSTIANTEMAYAA